MTTPIFNLPLWPAGSAQPEIDHNDALAILDLFIGGGVKSRTTDAQPGSPTEGDAYIITASATGTDWAGFTANNIAYYIGGTWSEYAPRARVRFKVDDDNELIGWTGSAWEVLSRDLPKTNFSATTDPGVSDDNTAGYSVGSRWINTTSNEEFVCLDAATGAADWGSTTAQGSGGGLIPVFKTAAYTASAGDSVRVDSSGGAFTVTLPATPSTGDAVEIRDEDGWCSTNAVTIGRNGETIDGAAADIELNEDWAVYHLVYDGSDWSVSASSAGAGIESDFIDAIRMQEDANSVKSQLAGATGRHTCLNLGPSGYEQCYFVGKPERTYDFGQIRWRVFWAPNSANTGNCKFFVISGFLDDGEDTAPPGSAVNMFTETASGNANYQQSTAWSAWTTLDGAPDERHLFYGRVQRQGDDAGDTYTGEMQVIGVEFQYRQKAPHQ